MISRRQSCNGAFMNDLKNEYTSAKLEVINIEKIDIITSSNPDINEDEDAWTEV